MILCTTHCPLCNEWIRFESGSLSAIVVCAHCYTPIRFVKNYRVKPMGNFYMRLLKIVHRNTYFRLLEMIEQMKDEARVSGKNCRQLHQ